MKLAFAFLCSATAFPAMLFERFKPLAPGPMKIAFDGATTTASATDTNITGKFDAWITIIYEAAN